MGIVVNFLPVSDDRVITFSEQIDQFQSSDFFKSDNGMEISDINVYAKSQSDAELREKMEKYLIENEIKGFDESVSNDEVFEKIQSKYLTRQKILSDIDKQIDFLRTKEIQDKAKEPDNSAE